MRLRPVLTAVSLVIAPLALTAAALNGVAVSSHGVDTGNAVEVRLPKAVEGRFVKLTAKTAANGKSEWCSAAEIRVLDGNGKEIAPGECKISGFSSQGDATEAAANALDNNPDTIWHTQWQGAAPKPPHFLVIDVGSVRAIGGIRVRPRKDGDNGNIGQYELGISANDKDFGQPVAAGKLFGGAGPAPAFVKKLYASSEQVHGPIAIHVDAQGRVWIAETYRYESQGIIQARDKARLELDELRLVTVDDHRRMVDVWKKEGEYDPFIKQKRVDWKDVDDFLTRFSEKIAYLKDTNGDGIADERVEFVGDGINDPVDGPMAGVFTLGNKVYATCIPDLLLIEDTNGVGVAS